MRRAGSGISRTQDDSNDRIAMAASQLRDALHFGRSIALVGLEHTAWEVQKAAIALAEDLGAWVVREPEFQGGGSPWAASFAQKGCTAASWGEIRLRSDAVVLWYAPLWHTHPHWMERFGPASSRAHRLAVVSPDSSLASVGWIEDQMIRVDPGQSNAFLRAVRASLKDDLQESPDASVRRFVHTVRNSHWLAIVRGDDPPGLADAFGVAESFADLVAEANSTGDRRVVSTHVPSEINAAGLDAVLSIRAGLSTPMRFTADGPARALGEWSADKADFVVSFYTGLSEEDIPAGIRFVTVDAADRFGPDSNSGRTISIPVGTCGLGASGTLIRGDGVVVPVRNVRKASDPDLLTILHALRNALRAKGDSNSAESGDANARFGAEAAQ